MCSFTKHVGTKGDPPFWIRNCAVAFLQRVEFSSLTTELSMSLGQPSRLVQCWGNAGWMWGQPLPNDNPTMERWGGPIWAASGGLSSMQTSVDGSAGYLHIRGRAASGQPVSNWPPGSHCLVIVVCDYTRVRLCYTLTGAGAEAKEAFMVPLGARLDLRWNHEKTRTDHVRHSRGCCFSNCLQL